jgi:hypothetical protein
MKYLLNKTEIAGKQFGAAEITKIPTGIADFYGGNVNYFGKTEEGFLLCLYKNTNKIIDIYIDEDLLTIEGLKMLSIDQGKEMLEVPKTKQEERKELLALAKELGVEGKIATMKTEDLKNKIREAQENGKESDKL